MHSELSHLLMPVWQVDFATWQQMENRPYDETIATLHKYKGRWQYGSGLGPGKELVMLLLLVYYTDFRMDSYFLASLILARTSFFLGEAKRLAMFTSGSLCGSALGKCLEQTWECTFTCSPVNSNTCSHRSHLAWSLEPGKR